MICDLCDKPNARKVTFSMQETRSDGQAQTVSLDAELCANCKVDLALATAKFQGKEFQS